MENLLLSGEPRPPPIADIVPGDSFLLWRNSIQNYILFVKPRLFFSTNCSDLSFTNCEKKAFNQAFFVRLSKNSGPKKTQIFGKTQIIFSKTQVFSPKIRFFPSKITGFPGLKLKLLNKVFKKLR